MATVDATRTADKELVAALRAGDEDAFAELVDRYSPAMLRLAQTFVKTRAVAEEVVQEAWLGVLKGLDRFEGRSMLKTWIFRILSNVAKTRAEREGRSLPFSALAPAGEGDPAVDPSRFNPAESAEAGAWQSPPRPWDEVPEERLISQETRKLIEAAVDELPEGQKIVITLRDIQGWPAVEVCNILGLSETNQRVLLHRARAKVRRALERYLDEG